MPNAPFPPSGQYLESVRSSAKAIRLASGIKVEPESVTRLLSSPAFKTTLEKLSTAHGLAFPLKFSSPASELNFLALLSLLNFGSGYRVPLHEAYGGGRGAWDTIRALLFGMFLTSTTGEDDLLSARGIAAVSTQKVADLLGFSLHVEKEHPTLPGVTVGELGGPIYEFCTLVSTTLNETGKILLDSGYSDLGAFLIEAMKEGEKAVTSEQPDAGLDKILERVSFKLVRAFPGFQDMDTINGQPVYCFKKALFLIHGICYRFGSLSPPPFAGVPKKTSSLPVFTDNVIPSMLVYLGILDVSGSRQLANKLPLNDLNALLAEAVETTTSGPKTVPQEGPTLTTEESYILRASAIDACELIVAHAPAELGLDLPAIDAWLWSVAKDRPDYRRLPRFVLRDMVYF